MAAPVVAVVGMAALRRDLNRMSSDISGPMYVALKAAGLAAAKPTVGATVGRLPSDSGRLAGTVRASGTRTGATVRMGRAGVPYAGWVDFGGSRPDGSERSYMPDGRYLFPAARDNAARAARSYSDALEKLFATNTSIWTNSGADPGSVHD